MVCLIDSNVLIRLQEMDHPEKPLCEECLRVAITAGVQMYICAQVLIEFWSVCTRPRDANGLGLDTDWVYGSIVEICNSIQLLGEPPDIAWRWLNLVRRYRVRGKEVHDARLVAFATAHNIPVIVTLNPSDFQRYSEVSVLTPRQMLDSLG